MADEPPDEPPPHEEQPAWMTPEGRLREIPFRKLEEGETYTLEERERLLQYWEHERVEEVAQWISCGAPGDSIPECVPTTTEFDLDPRTLNATTHVVFDLRRIPLGEYLATPRTPQSPPADLRWARLEHAYLEGAHLEHVNLIEAHLEHANLTKAHLEHANLFLTSLQDVNLREARLDHANLNETHSDRANLFGASLQHASLVRAQLEHAWLFGARLEHANLHGAHLQHADVRWARLEHADFSEARLEHADLTGAWILRTAFTNVYLDDTVFRDVVWRDERRRDPEARLFRGFDVRGIRYSDPLFDQWVRQANFIHAKREIWWNPWRWMACRAPRLFRLLANWPPPLWLLWKGTCDCGRSFRRWAITCAAVAVLFGLLFWLCADFWGMPVVELEGAVDLSQTNEPGRIVYPTTYLYFSIVTFTTLGFGDVTPTGLLGEFLVTLEVILGYIGLGGLISIFTTKLIPPR